MMEQQVESESEADDGDSAMAAFLEAVKKMQPLRILILSFDSGPGKESRGEARKAYLQQTRIRINENRVRMELRKADNAVPRAATSSSSTASPPKPNFHLIYKLPKSSSPAAEKHISDDQIKPVLVQPLCLNYVVPPYIEKSSTLALEKYNNEKSANYRYVRPLRAHEEHKAGDAIYTLTFRASQTDSDSKTFITKITCGLRFSKGEWLFGKEVQQVYQVPGLIDMRFNNRDIDQETLVM